MSHALSQHAGLGSQDEAKALHWRIGKSLLTRSDRWGLVWRVNVQTLGMAGSRRVSRVVYWGDPGGGEVCGSAYYTGVNRLE